MPFDPTKPAPGDDLDAVLMRNQLNALKTLVDAVPAGPAGPQGPPFAGVVVDGVTTLPPGTPVSVTAFFDGSDVRFTFGIPKGADGLNGSNGNDGPPGPAGEVTNGALNAAITAALGAAAAASSANSNGVATLGLTVSDPPTQAEMQALANKLDELITALRR